MTDFLDIITQRGFVHQLTDEAGLRELLKTSQRAYIGFDCTAKSLHVGSLLQIMLLRWWQKCGHTPIVLLGGGTTKIGDPSGKDSARPKLDDAAIAANMESLKQVFSRFIDFSANEAPENPALMVNNDDWLRDINYLEFLRDYGRHFSVNRMLTMDSVKLRLEREQPLSFLEFNYMILQAYDFVELSHRYGCRVQMGGSDQWGNIINGIELGSSLKALDANAKKVGITTLEISDLKKTPLIPLLYKHLAGIRILSAATTKEVSTGKHEVEYTYVEKEFGITSPLITTASGTKMGKTEGGAVWLNADLCSPYDYWQFWRNTEDGDVVRFLKLFTELPLDEIAELGALKDAAINEAKIRLATEATALLHGREAAEQAAATARETFAGSGMSENLPELVLDAAALAAGIPMYELLVKAGFATSNGEARRLIKGQGVSLNDVKVTDENARLSAADVLNGTAKLSKGKKQHLRLVG